MPISDPISRTSKWIAAARAVETRRPDRLFEDPFAESLAGPDGFELLGRMSLANLRPGALPDTENPYLAIRTRFIDDFLRASLADPANRQVVVLAAGLDARAYRLEWPAGTRVFELDRAEVLDIKSHALDARGHRPRCERLSVAVDFARPFAPALQSAGFDARQPAAWLLEGLLPYLDRPEAHAVVAQCASLAFPGSPLVADMVGESFLTSPWTQRLIASLREMNAPWRFATDAPEQFFAESGWDATVRRPGEPDAHYGRWPYPVAPRDTPGLPQSFLVTARRR